MEQSYLRKILALVQNGELSLDDAMLKIREEPYTDLGYAMIDNHRQLRQGFAEVIYGEGKRKGSDSRNHPEDARKRRKDHPDYQTV